MPVRAAVQVVTSTARRMIKSTVRGSCIIGRVAPPGKGSVLSPRGFAGASLVLLALTLPFEAPLFHAGPLLITPAELALYLALAAWLVAAAAPGAWWQRAPAAVRGALADPFARAVLLWLLVVLVSALAAPAWRGAALKF